MHFPYSYRKFLQIHFFVHRVDDEALLFRDGTPVPCFLYAVVQRTEQQSPCFVEKGLNSMAKSAGSKPKDSIYGFCSQNTVMYKYSTQIKVKSSNIHIARQAQYRCTHSKLRLCSNHNAGERMNHRTRKNNEGLTFCCR
jgi:hypothetical protein